MNSTQLLSFCRQRRRTIAGGLVLVIAGFTTSDTHAASTSATPRAIETPREGECANNPFPDVNPGPGSLKALRPVDPPNLHQFIQNRQAAIVLGKALFWDMQVGSDGIQSCATCHFRAGADPRSKNQLAPGGKNNSRQIVDLGVNRQLTPADYPLHVFANPTDRMSAVLRTTDDVTSSAGVKSNRFTGVVAGADRDLGTPTPDPVFNIHGRNTRRVEPRNTPTVINAAFNRRSLWDGRADPIFNGVNEFGVRDEKAFVAKFDFTIGRLAPTKVRIEPASLASQAVGPPVNDTEMGFAGRPFGLIGRRLLTAVPLAKQNVAHNDSVFQQWTSSSAGTPRKGLTVTYDVLVQMAFKSEWWASKEIVIVNQDRTIRFRQNDGRLLAENEYTQMEYNFSLFFGLALQMYQATLISDDAPIDRFFEGNQAALTTQQKRGLALFTSGELACAACHSGAEFSNASTRIILGANGEPAEVIERMLNGQCETVIYDQSFYNIGVRPTEEDLGIGGVDPWGNPFSIAKLLTMDPAQVPSKELLRISYPNIASPPPQRGERVSANGAFKVPSLRNVALTAPYFHNGGQRTLRQVIEFYNRGGDFREHNVQFIDFEIGKLNLSEAEIDDLVSFLHALTDPRVVQQTGVFDHPQLFVPSGHSTSGSDLDGSAPDQLIEVPAVGRTGGPLPKGFLE
jgi:cytochrome c peroxidase